ncbi:alpha/beta hydrolase [Nocardia callitridis]|uniref:Alpha/beta hydrolase n=1 Tax=Nocardia callitridis TaxID=648753 RepID=A0ABP9KXM8_9NOCA
MSLRRSVLLVVAAFVLGSGTVVACASSPPAGSTIAWTPCQENAEFDCAAIPVPVDWSDPDSATVDIAVVRDRADEPARKLGTLVSLPGGPGKSGVDEIIAGGKFSSAILARFDVISLDPRGVGRSHPVRCDADLAAHRPNLVPDLGGRIEEVHAYARELADSCRRYTGPLLEHVDATSVARDVDALRSALGEQRISVYSRSYGTMSAQAYAELFPERLRAMVLDSVDDHIVSGREMLASAARAGADTFGEFVAWCGREQQCVLHGVDIEAAFEDLYSRAGRGVLRDPASGTVLGPLDLSTAVTQRLDTPEWSRLATDLRSLIDQPSVDLPPAAAPPAPAPAAVATPWVIACSDWKFEVADQAQWSRLWQEQNAAAGALHAHFAWAAGSVCSGWPTAHKNPPHPPRGDEGPAIVIMNSRHDPATPHEWARNVTANTPNAVLLTYDGWGHGVYGRTPCTTGTADRYLIDLTIPPAETHCPAG